jgi:N-acylglucosamine-6-phosphate 2-epimerase
MPADRILDGLKGGLIVSCQAQPGSPLRDSAIMVAMAKAAEVGGAVGIRANGPEDIAAIRAAVRLPIIGILKQDLRGFDVRITPTVEAAETVVAAGADILALDATQRPHPGGLPAGELIAACRRRFGLGVLIMADVSTLAEGVAAAGAGADLVGTTLSGYTPYSRQLAGPDFELIAELAGALRVPVIAEGRIATPEDARRALELGACAVVVGAAITQPEAITRRFVAAL